jgi:hypothetical protein
VLTDNAAVFTAASRGGRTALQVQLLEHGIACKHSRPYHPQTCGKVQRLHQTVKKWLTKQPRPTTVAALSHQLALFRRLYNTDRPPRALGQRTPQQPYTRPKAHPAQPNRAVDRYYRVRTDTVDSCGKVTLRHAGRLHHIGLGRAHAGTTIHLAVADLHVRITDTHGTLIRELTLDPTRDYQPQS